EEAARAEADQRLHRLEARALRVVPRVEEAEHARAGYGSIQIASRPTVVAIAVAPTSSRSGVPTTSSSPPNMTTIVIAVPRSGWSRIRPQKRHATNPSGF